MRKQSQYLSNEEHREVHRYFYALRQRHLQRFAEHWDKIGKFDPRQTKKIAGILYYIAKDLPDHAMGSEEQRKVGKYVKQNFATWERKALMALRDFTPKELSNALWAVAMMGASPSKYFMSAARKEINRCLKANNAEGSFNAQNFSNSLLAIAVIQSQNPNLDLKPIYEDLREGLNLTDFEEVASAKQIYDADIYFTGDSDIKNPIDKETTSLAEKQLSQIFKKAGYDVFKSKTCPIPKLNKAIDFSVRDTQTGKVVHIEFDGPPHFHNPEAIHVQNLKYNLATRFRSALMTRLAPDAHIVRIDFRLFEALVKNDKSTKDKFCRAVFERAVKRGPGCYHVTLSKEMLTDMVPKEENHAYAGATSTSSAVTSHPQAGVNDNAGSPVPQTPPNLQSTAARPAPTGV